MLFSTFLFPDSRDPARDGAVIDETMREALLADELGADVVWLAEHHFDGIAVYADPIALAGALAAALRHAGLGFAVLQTALHHPIRLAEQIALLDHLLKGRLIVGLGRGSSYNIYDYQGFGIDHHEAPARRVGLYRETMRAADHGEAAVAANLKASWVWRNFFVAATDAEAERVAIPAFETMTRARAELRNRVFAETGQRIAVPANDLPG